MIKYNNDCNDCEIQCVNCGLKHNAHFICDKCGCEEILYEHPQGQLCKDCLLDLYEEVEEEN